MLPQQDKSKPIRVVMFGSGPELNHDVRQFLLRLEQHPEIELLGAFCQAEGQSVKAVFQDLQQRRGRLALPLFCAWLAGKFWRLLQNPRQEAALRRGLKKISPRIHFIKDIHQPDVLELVRALQPDLGLIYGSPILKPVLFEIPRLGTIGIHHGKLPEYRGNKTAFWAIYNGEQAAGVTIQKINAGLDTGSIIRQGEVMIGKKTYPRVMRELENLGLELYIQSILDMKNGTAVMIPQPAPKGKLYRNPKLSDFLAYIQKQVKAWIRGNQ